jgi:hypothetical protein
MRWNAMVMVVKANRLHPADGGDLYNIRKRRARKTQHKDTDNFLR